MAAVRQPVGAGREFAGGEEGVGIALHIDLAGGDVLVDGREIFIDQRGNPDIHRGDNVKIIRPADHFGGQALAQRGEGNVDIGHLDSGRLGEGGDFLGMRGELRRLHGQDLHFFAGEGLSGRDRGQSGRGAGQKPPGSERGSGDKRFTAVDHDEPPDVFHCLKASMI